LNYRPHAYQACAL